MDAVVKRSVASGVWAGANGPALRNAIARRCAGICWGNASNILMMISRPPFMGRARKVQIPGEGEQDSGVKANSNSGGKANGFHPIPEWLSRCPE